MVAGAVVVLMLVGADGFGPAKGDPASPQGPGAVATESSSPSVEASPSGLRGIDARNLARDTLLPLESALIEGYETVNHGSDATEFETYSPLYRCLGSQPFEADLLARYFQYFTEVRPAIVITSSVYERSSSEILNELRGLWESECESYERASDAGDEELRSSERIDPVAPPDGVPEGSWLADCSVNRMLEDGSDGVITCQALVAVADHAVVEIILVGHYSDLARYEELLGSIALEILAEHD